MTTQYPSIWESLRQNLEIAMTLRRLEIHFDEARCVGAWECCEVCPVGCWTPDYARRKAIYHDAARCIACGACVLQCPEDAIRLE